MTVPVTPPPSTTTSSGAAGSITFGGPDQGEPPNPPTTEGQAPERDAEITALKSEAARWRKALREKEAENESLKSATATDTERAINAARAEGAAEYAKKWRGAVLQNAALSALADRGVEAPGLAIRALDLDDVDIDDAGKVDPAGLDLAINTLLQRWPQLLPRSAPQLPNVSGDHQPKITADQVVNKDMSDKDVEAYLRYAMQKGV